MFYSPKFAWKKKLSSVISFMDINDLRNRSSDEEGYTSLSITNASSGKRHVKYDKYEVLKSSDDDDDLDVLRLRGDSINAPLNKNEKNDVKIKTYIDKSRENEAFIESSKKFNDNHDSDVNLTTTTKPVNIRSFVTQVIIWNVLNVAVLAGVCVIIIFIPLFEFYPLGIILFGVFASVWPWAYLFVKGMFQNIPIIREIGMIVVSLIGGTVFYSISVGFKWYTFVIIFSTTTIIILIVYLVIIIFRARMDKIKQIGSPITVSLMIWGTAVLLPLASYDQADGLILWIFIVFAFIVIILLNSEIAEVFQGVGGHHNNMNVAIASMNMNILISGIIISLAVIARSFKSFGFILPIPNPFTYPLMTWIVDIPSSTFHFI